LFNFIYISIMDKFFFQSLIVFGSFRSACGYRTKLFLEPSQFSSPSLLFLH
jgi:hypothetical protein